MSKFLMARFSAIVGAVVFLTALSTTHAETLDDFGDGLFTTLSPDFCTLNHLQSGAFGCTSANDINRQPGDTGPIWPVFSQAALDTLDAAVSEPVTVLIPPELLTNENVEKLADGGLVSSIFVLGDEKPSGAWSLPGPFPNAQWGLRTDLSPDDATVAWNPQGQDMTDTRLKLPIAWVKSEEDLTLVREAAARNLENGLDVYPRFLVELGIFAPSAGTTQQCWNRGRQSFSPRCFFNKAVGAWGGPAKIEKGDSIILVEARYDSIGLFHNTQPGGVAYTADVVAALGAFATLADHQDDLDEAAHKIAFSFAPGDRWGYQSTKTLILASQNPDSFSETQIQGLGKFNMDNIEYILDIEQVGLNASDTLIAYTESGAGDASDLVSALSAIALDSNVTDLTVAAPSASALEGIPPSALMSWIAANTSMRGVVLAGHDGAFNNDYYGTPFDDRDNVDDTTVCGAATIVARTLYMLANDSSDPNDVPATVQADCALISDLLDCMINGYPCAESTRLGLDRFDGSRGLKFAGDAPIGSLFPRNSDMTFASSFMLDRANYDEGPSCDSQAACVEDEFQDCIADRCVSAEVNYFYWAWEGISFTQSALITDIDETLPHYAQAEPRGVIIRLYEEEDPALVRTSIATAVFVLVASVLAVLFLNRTDTLDKLKIH